MLGIESLAVAPRGICAIRPPVTKMTWKEKLQPAEDKDVSFSRCSRTASKTLQTLPETSKEDSYFRSDLRSTQYDTNEGLW